MRPLCCRCVLAGVVAALLVQGVAHADPPVPTDWLTPKQIAAPPEDFLSGMLRLPRPETTGRESDSALLPIDFVDGVDGRRTWEVVVPIGDASDLRLMLLGPDAEQWKLVMTTPDGGKLSSQDTAPLSGMTRTADAEGVLYTIRGHLDGAWKLQIEASDGANATDQDHLLIADGAPCNAYTHVKSLDLIAGRQLAFITYLCEDVPRAQRGDTPDPIPGAVSKAELRLRLPNGQEIVTPMADDGAGEDDHRGDSKFTGSIRVDSAGEYVAQIVVEGVTPNGRRVLRTSQHLVTVAPGGAELGRSAIAVDRSIEAVRVDIPVLGVSWTDRLQVSAEVWGRDAQGNALPICWISGMVGNDPDAKACTASLRLDKRWITRAGASAPLELRNIRVQDPKTHIPIAQRAAMSMRVDGLDLSRTPRDVLIDDVMRHGRYDRGRSLPIWPNNTERSAQRATCAHNLMLIHGYCSQFPLWPAQDFNGFIELFQDPGESRSYDEFAQLLVALGNQSKSFGVVAHSQGGAAALHLYTFYWSGLDWATGPRLIQSVGTPYQGTPLASDIAFLGQIFGAGCGTNFDLTPEGAALWLAGIPSAARGQVHYWTTSFLDDFGFDFCNLVTDFLLTDPDDGVIEMFRGQLPGANNMGHTEGQCHTTGMRDPAQYTDVSRNMDMNANAAR